MNDFDDERTTLPGSGVTVNQSDISLTDDELRAVYHRHGRQLTDEDLERLKALPDILTVSGSPSFVRDPRLSRLAENVRHHASRPEWRIPKDERGRNMERCPVCDMWQRREAFSPERYRSGHVVLHKVCKTCRAAQKRTGRPPGRPSKADVEKMSR